MDGKFVNRSREIENMDGEIEIKHWENRDLGLGN